MKAYIKKFILRKPSLFFCSIRLCSMCSQACLQCSIPSQSDGSYIDLTDYAAIIRKLKQYGTRILTFTGGEPALHPQLEEIFCLAYQQNFQARQILTNLYYGEERQEELIALAQKYDVGIHTSYDGFGEVVDRLRGAKKVQETVERGMLKINRLRAEGKYRHRPTATVVISALNIDQLPRIIDRLQALDWNINIDFYRWGSANHNENDLLKIKDSRVMLDAIRIIRGVKNLKTPLWYYDGLEKQITGKIKKQCPYLISPTFGSKFFVHENGDIKTCMNDALGNLLTQGIDELFEGRRWEEQKKRFEDCEGCWNTCYTISSRALSYLHYPSIRQYMGHARRARRTRQTRL